MKLRSGDGVGSRTLAHVFKGLHTPTVNRLYPQSFQSTPPHRGPNKNGRVEKKTPLPLSVLTEAYSMTVRVP